MALTLGKLRMAAVAESRGSGKVWEVVVVEAGVSKNGNHYRPEVLEASIPALEGRPVGIYSFGERFDHADMELRAELPEGVAGNVVGVLRNCRMAEVDSVLQRGKKVQAIVADLYVTDEWLRSTLANAEESGGAEFLELSIEATGTYRPGIIGGRPVRDFTQIREYEELTVVTNGAAGGRFARMVASYAPEADPGSADTATEAKEDLSENNEKQQRETPGGGNKMNIGAARRGLVKTLRAMGFQESVEELDTTEVLALLSEQYKKKKAQMREMDASALEAVLAMLGEGDVEGAMGAIEALLADMPEMEMAEADPEPEPAPEPTPAPAATPEPAPVAAAPPAVSSEVTEAEKRMLESERRARLLERKIHLNNSLATSNLPKSAQDAVRSQFAERDFEDGALVRAIESQRRVVNDCTAAAAGSAAGRNPRVQMGASRFDRLKVQALQLFGVDVNRDARATESEKKIARDLGPMVSLKGWFREMTGRDAWDMHRGLGRDAAIHEATTADLTQLLGDSAERALMQGWNEAEKLWEAVAQPTPISNFKTQRRVLVGGLGIMPTVTQGATYAEAGFPADVERTYSAAKRGYLLKLTFEMIANDDLDGLRAIPKEIVDSSVHTLNYVVLRCAVAAVGGTIGADTSYDGVGIYHANHRNLASSALDYQAAVDMWERLHTQRRFANVLEVASTFNSGGTTLTLRKEGGDTISDLSQFLKVDDVLQIDEELLLVTAVSTSNTCTVTRALEGTSQTASSAAGTRVEQLGAFLTPRQVLLAGPTQLGGQIAQLLNSPNKPGSNNNDVNALKRHVDAGRLKDFVVPAGYLYHDINNWFMWADQPVEVGFFGGQQEPTLLLQDNPMYGESFTGDVFTWKARQIYGCVLTDHRKVQGSLV